MRRIRIDVLLAANLYLLASVVPSHTTEISEDGEEYEDDVGVLDFSSQKPQSSWPMVWSEVGQEQRVLELPGISRATGLVLTPLKLATSICAMKADHGPCKALHDRYHFNIKTRQCELFNYGGCQGNENNFLTLQECQEKCIVPVADLPEKKKRSRFKKEKPSYCLLENDPGICRGLITRYFYNQESQICEQFLYGGCLGNQNNFRSLEECQDTCQDIISPDNSLQTEDASVPFRAVDNSTPAVQQVPLVPSANTLQAQDDTMLLRVISNSTPVVKQEQDRLPSLCIMRMDRGLCRAQEKRFFYNYTIGKCRPFSYTGCGGNENNFTTRKSCLQMCKKGFIQGQKGIMKIRRKRKKRVKLVDDHFVTEQI
ncbi:tissue factor pathway inhibitor isoform X3 [Sceloporus undulatus]|uniref:tissue factor pathway inhibitor isoform X3 n=1 Tax=Sceloporus undulatus TaxID=8520 RepID=UPI001C4B58DD|nr:tissue factor pathway inhibitor isoform X3 [Sceloporus undulatus]